MPFCPVLAVTDRTPMTCAIGNPDNGGTNSVSCCDIEPPPPRGGAPPARALSAAALPIQLSAVPQARGDPIDRQVNALDDGVIAVAATVASQQLELQVVERIEIGKPVADGADQHCLLIARFTTSLVTDAGGCCARAAPRSRTA
jgi:hypothetical protein